MRALFVNQTFEIHDLAVVGFLVLLEGLLSADNALVLAVMVRHLPEDRRQKALLFGLGGAFAFRFVAILFARAILSLWWLQAVGALYLLWLAVKHFAGSSDAPEAKEVRAGFWRTVISVEIADIAFAADSVLAAVSTVGEHPDKLWVVYSGAAIGVVLLRFAAGAFIKLLERFPSLEQVAYAIVGWVGVKLAMMAINDYEKAAVESRTSIPWGIDVPEMSAAVFWIVLAVIAAIGGWMSLRKPADPVS